MGLFINARPTIDISFCQFIRKYIQLHSQIPTPNEHVASFYFEGQLFYLACKNFSVDENLVWTRELWFLRASQFLVSFRANNYKSTPNQFSFPVPYFGDQKHTNEYTLLLLLLDRVAFLDSMTPETFQLIILEIFKNFSIKDSILDLLLQISVNGQRTLSKLETFFKVDSLSPKLKLHIEAQLNKETRGSLPNILIHIYNDKQTGINKYKPLAQCNYIKFIDTVFTPEEFNAFWEGFRAKTNILILNDERNIVTTPFVNKNCRVQKSRCWVFKQLARLDLFESKVEASSLVLLTTTWDSINAYEIGQNQRISINGVYKLASAVEIYDAPLEVGKVTILLAPDLSLQDVWLLLEMQIMSLYQINIRRVIFFDMYKHMTNHIGASRHVVFNWHVLLVYLLWYATTYAKNLFVIYSWQFSFKNCQFLSLYKTVFNNKADSTSWIERLHSSNWCWFKHVKIKSNGHTRYFGAFQSTEPAVQLRRVHSAKQKYNLTRHLLYCFGADDILPYSQTKNTLVTSWDAEFDFSAEDLTVWFD